MPPIDADFQKAKLDFDRDGFVILRGFFSPVEVKELAAKVNHFIADVVPTLPPADAFYEVKGKPETLKQMQRLEQHDPYFAGLTKHERMIRLGELLLEDTLVPYSVAWFNKPARIGQFTPPHQDGYYFMLEPNEAITCWIALDVVDSSNGCVRYVAGSHKLPMRPHGRTDTLGFSQSITDYGPADTALEQEAAVAPGDLLVHHSMAIHTAGANTSDKSRRALGIVFYASRAKENRAAAAEYQRKLLKDLAVAGKI